ncbi:MAG: beta-galactosidase [Chloroflexi bacterium]|nr:beta-galactosidase [Chloroflexota bacterium]
MSGMEINLVDGWRVVQDVHDLGEQHGLYRVDWDPRQVGRAVSDWEPIDRLAHLQLLFAEQPYFGRALRHFNDHPWWYRLEFRVPEGVAGRGATLRFEGVDYYASVWLNEALLGEHEGYFEPFEFEVGHLLRHDRPNVLVVKVSSPWDTEIVPGREARRFSSVLRQMVKGTYEHCDTFIQRDVNPVGIWRPVRLLFHDGLRAVADPCVVATVVDDAATAEVAVAWPVALAEGERDAEFAVRIFSEPEGLPVAAAIRPVTLRGGTTTLEATLAIERPRLWSTWDRGGPSLYRLELALRADGRTPLVAGEQIGIRTVGLRRSPSETTFLLNGRPIFLRGTSYFPDCYLSAVDRGRYERDVAAMVRAGMNAVRVHVHVENPEFYEVCDRLGVVVLQDSDLNWFHPVEARFTERCVGVFGALIRRLRNHPSVICWVCLNEPGGGQQSELARSQPGPQLVAAARHLDPTRPTIKSSGHPDDPESGDSHTYLGSLDGNETHYTDVHGTTEKLCTEFGFDAPPAAARVHRVPRMAARLARVLPRIGELHDYQYRLTKYYVEHYRIQKYAPCAGYFQFMWIDLCPQSFYGVYDHWGCPKGEGSGGGLRALEESNAPIGILMEHRDGPVALWAVNDLLADWGTCVAEWVVTTEEGEVVARGEARFALGPDARVRVGDLRFPVPPESVRCVALTLRDAEGRALARNLYRDPFRHPPHPAGHPQRMDHELGMRLYWG